MDWMGMGDWAGNGAEPGGLVGDDGGIDPLGSSGQSEDTTIKIHN